MTSDVVEPDDLTPPGYGDDLKFDEDLISTRDRVARRNGFTPLAQSDVVERDELVTQPASSDPVERHETSAVNWPRALTTLMAASSDLKTQQALARKSGVAQSTIGRILLGRVDPQSENLVRIARAFGLSLAGLAALAQEGQPATEPNDIPKLSERSTREALTPTGRLAPVDKVARLERTSRLIKIKLANGHSVVLREKVGTKTLSRVLDVLVRL
jgi:transcriptional regulator with XRE-family HTH domain